MTKQAMTKKSVQPTGSISAWGGVVIVSVIAASVAYAITSASTAFTPQDQPVGYVAQDEITNFNLTSGNERIFRPDYSREFWNGNLDVYPVDAGGNINFSTEPWVGGAAAQLATQNWDTGRFIATRNAGAPSSGVAFRYASLSVAQQVFFPAGMINTTSYTGDQIVNFLRGERLNESPAGMRNRSAEANGTGGPTLGDIIHSRPFYVADATNPTVFVGANDGMLHSFNANNGMERWAYVPSMLLKKMAKLARPYGTVSNPHDYFVDGRINISSVTISGTPKRILVGALGAGGRGIYALNIDGSTGLSASSDAGVASKALWEIDGDTGKLNNQAPTLATAYNNLGYTYGTPAIAKVNVGGVDAVIIGNGFNDNPSGDHQAYLYVIDAATGQLIGNIQAGTTGTLASPNGLFNPAPIDTNADGKADIVYAGDLKGTLWKFDLTDTAAASNWTSAALHVTSPAQPIVTTPGVALHPQGGRMVTFGTGTMFDTADTASTGPFYVYGVWDGPFTNTTMMSPTLEERNYVFGTPSVTTRVRRALSITTPDWSSGGHKGWQVALPTGERVVGEGSFIASGRFYFASHNPTVSTSTGPGGVTTVTTNVTGSGYTAATISFSGGGGNGATAFPVISAGQITSINVTSSGTGYTSAPSVVITGDGTGATANATLSASTLVHGENWLMELDYLTGGSQDRPFLDLDDNQILNNNDRIKYISTDTLPSGASVGGPIVAATGVAGTDGIPVGKYLSNGVMSQPILVQLAVLNTTLFNRNSDVIFPVTEVTYGVQGGHFDTDIFYNQGTKKLCTSTAGTSTPASKAIASITVGITGQTTNFPATLGGITVNGATIVSSLSASDIPNGTATSTNAALIQSRVGGGYTATISGNKVTLYAPVAGSSYNGYVVAVLPGTSAIGTPGTPGSPGTPATPATDSTGLIAFSGKTNNASKLLNNLTGSLAITVGSNTARMGAVSIGDKKVAKDVVAKIVGAIGTGGLIKAYVGGNSITPTCASQPDTTLCLVDTSGAGNGQTVSMGSIQNAGTLTATITNTAGATAASLGTPATPGTPATGWSDFAPALTVTNFSGGADAMAGVTITTNCKAGNGSTGAHIHQYDDKYDRTGLDMLNPSATTHRLSNAVTSNIVKYKVLVHNQYLNPAVKLHIGDSSYEPSVDFGYVSVKDYQTTSTLSIASLPTYNGTSNSTGSSGLGFLPIGSLVYNMPTDALTSKDWWGNGDVRVGLHPINPGCGGRDGNISDGNLYMPMIPPANGTDGPATRGWSASTNSLNSVGVRHAGALTIQLIKDTTPQSAIELNDSLERPEYGWRVKSGLYDTYVLVEYTVYWHHPTNGCYDAASWTKIPGPDDGASTATSPAAGSTDPKIGNLAGAGGGSVTSVSRTVVGNVVTTTITYSTGGQAIITRTETTGSNGQKIITTDTRNADCVAAGAGCTGISDVVYQDTRQSNIVNGGDEQGQRARTGRVSWHEIINE